MFVGYGAPYDKTVESYLQQILNENDEGYLVENVSQFYNGRYQDIFYNLNALPVKEGDIIFICINDRGVRGIPFFNMRNLFCRPHEYGEVFIDEYHINEVGNHIVAQKFYEWLKDNNWFNNYKYPNQFIPLPHMYGIPEWTLNTVAQSGEFGAGLTEYKNKLKELRRKIFGRTGAIVMNCNPFTLGHRYLIEYAAKKVGHLFVFAVEENKSVFSFEDRICLIKEGTKDISNVEVLPSGKYIISSLTFSDYFNKSQLQDTVIDPSMDVELFATEIAPQLGIDVRFVGEEPLDKITKQYNDTMRRILPNYCIDFEEIPRKEFGGQVISASRVRALMIEGDFKSISKIVPDTTLKYLKENKDRIIKDILRERFIKVNDGEKYVQLLTENNDRYTYLIAVKDTPCKITVSDFVRSMALKLRLKTDFSNSYRKAFIAVVNNSQVIYEGISDNPIEYSGELKDKLFKLQSAGFLFGNYAKIIIDGTDYAVNSRGFNIVVFDKISKEVFDSVCIDTFSNNLKLTRQKV